MSDLKCVKCQSKIPEGLRIDQKICPKCKTLYKPIKGKWYSKLGRAIPWKEPKG